MSEALDKLVLELRALKAKNGDPSFSELARMVAGVRQQRGVDQAKARVATSTLNDAFRTGRSRLNPALVRDIVVALTGDSQQGEEWAARAGFANAKLNNAADNTADDSAISHLVDANASTSLNQAGGEVSAIDPAVTTGARKEESETDERAKMQWDGSYLDAELGVTTQTTKNIQAHTGVFKSRKSTGFLIALVLGGVAIDFLVPLVINAIYRGYQPLFLDMIGTAVVAMLGGPWLGALTGLFSTGASALLAGPPHLVFALVKIAGAIIWGYGIKYVKSNSYFFPKYLALNVIVAIVCSTISVSIIIGLFGYDLRHPLATILTTVITQPEFGGGGTPFGQY